MAAILQKDRKKEQIERSAAKNTARPRQAWASNTFKNGNGKRQPWGLTGIGKKLTPGSTARNQKKEKEKR